MGEVGGGGIRGSVKGKCWRFWWGNKGQCERWGWKGGLGERWVNGSGVKFNSQNSVALRCANYQ